MEDFAGNGQTDGMFTTLLGSILLLEVLGALVMMRGTRHATEGYEDEAGFHQGREPELTIVGRDHFQRHD